MPTDSEIIQQIRIIVDGNWCPPGPCVSTGYDESYVPANCAQCRINTIRRIMGME